MSKDGPSAQYRRTAWVFRGGRRTLRRCLITKGQGRCAAGSDVMHRTPEGWLEDRQACVQWWKLTELAVIMWDVTCTPPASRTFLLAPQGDAPYLPPLEPCRSSALAACATSSQALQRRTEAVPTASKHRNAAHGLKRRRDESVASAATTQTTCDGQREQPGHTLIPVASPHSRIAQRYMYQLHHCVHRRKQQVTWL